MSDHPHEESAGPKKIAIFGSGAIGSRLLAILHEQYPDCNIVVDNRDSPTSTGAALVADQERELSSLLRRGKNRISGRFDFTKDAREEALRGADIAVLAGGGARTSDSQTRLDLAVDSYEFMKPIAEAAGRIARENPEHKTTFVIGTNPVDVITDDFQKISGIPHNQIIGLSGELDATRLGQSIRHNLHVGYDDIRNAHQDVLPRIRVLGQHGDAMVPILSEVEVRKDGRWQKLLDMPEVHANNGEILKELKRATVKGGGILATLNKKSDFKGPSTAMAYMIEQLVDAKWGDPKASLPVTGSVHVAAPGGDIYMGQTVVFNKDGTHSPANVPQPSPEEQQDLRKSIEQSQKDYAMVLKAVQEAQQKKLIGSNGALYPETPIDVSSNLTAAVR